MTLLEDSADEAFLPRALGRIRLDGGGYADVIVEFDEDKLYKCGQRLELDGKLRRCNDSSTGYCRQKGTLLLFKAYRVEVCERTSLGDALVEFRCRALDAIGAEDDAHAVMQALSCGYRANLSGTRLYSAFQTAGLAHMVAVSGAHLVIVTALVSSLFKTLRVPRMPSIAVLVLLMGTYTVMAGMPLSCIRAATMSSIGILSLLGKRRPSSLNALGIAIFAIILNAPCAAVSVSFALSALATMGIVVFGPFFEMLLEKVFGSGLGGLAQGIALSLSASFLAQWYASSVFKLLPVISPLSNVLCAPLLPLCCMSGLIAAIAGACGCPGSSVLIDVAAMMDNALIAAVSTLAEVPHASVPVSLQLEPALAGATACGLIAWVLWEKILVKRILATCLGFALALLVAFSIMPDEDAIVMLDVGQGDSFLVSSEGKNLLIDTGNQDRKLLDQLARCHVAHLDWIVVTHADDDHCGSLDAIQRAVDVDAVALADGVIGNNDEQCEQLVAVARETGKELVGLKASDAIAVGRFTASVLWPKTLTDSGGNADSVVLEVAYDADGDGVGDLKALFPGDAEKEQLKVVISENDLQGIDILKVAHHGSRNAMDEGQVEQLDPRIALIGVGENNRYGHPAEEIIDMLDGIGCTVFRTDIDGGVKLELQNRSVIVHRL